MQSVSTHLFECFIAADRGANEGGCGGVRHPPNNLITIVKSVPNCVNLRIKVNYSFYCPCFTRFIPKN